MNNKLIKQSKIAALSLAVTGIFACSPDSSKNTEVPSKITSEVSEVSASEQAPHKAKLAEIRAAANQGPFKANWESFKDYKIPDWYKDAKFGIFIHWGVYSVPAFNGEWYPRWMYNPEAKAGKNGEYFNFHREKYGSVDKFGYKDFIPMFKAEKFDAAEWLKIIKESGAKYMVPVAEHHDGFSMYDNSYTRWDAVEMGPKRDIIGELKEASKGTGVHFGLSSHRAENWWFFDGGRKYLPSDVVDDEYRDLYGPAVDKETSESGETPPSQEFMDDWLLRTVEIVDKYQPELIWFDWWMASVPFHKHVQDFTAYYYNKGSKWENMPALNYKEHADFRSFPPGTAVLDIERGGTSGIHPHFWQTDTSVSLTSWGYVTNHTYRNANSLVDDLIDIVSKNGTLLLNIGPKPDGTIPQPEVDLLKEIGDWLALNGEAIYGTRPWVTFGEGTTEVVDGKNANDAEKHRKDFNETDVRFTQKPNTLYAVLMAWPGNNKSITIKSINAKNFSDKIKSVSLFGHDGDIEFKQTPAGLEVTLPASSPSTYAQALKVSY